jgi:Ran GTPase-activating protein (RanGAP) involved in mRNA processing and transport
MRGIADALKVNSNIKYLIFEDNWMSPEATGLIGDILRENNSIRVLNLRECRIGEQGKEHFFNVKKKATNECEVRGI